MKHQKIKQIQEIANEKPEVIRNLQTGKIYHAGREITEAELRRMQNKHITIDMGRGEL